MWYKHLSAGCFPFSSWADPKSLNPPRHVRTHNENIHTCINQQNECAPSADSDQPGHSPSLIRVFAVRMKKAWVLSYPLSAQRRLIRLVGCPGWSEYSLCVQPHCWFCHVGLSETYRYKRTGQFFIWNYIGNWYVFSKYLDNYWRYQYCANDTLFRNISSILRSIFQDILPKKDVAFCETTDTAHSYIKQ